MIVGIEPLESGRIDAEGITVFINNPMEPFLPLDLPPEYSHKIIPVNYGYAEELLSGHLVTYAIDRVFNRVSDLKTCRKQIEECSTYNPDNPVVQLYMRMLKLDNV